MHHILALYHRINVYIYSEDDGAECIICVHYFVFTMRNESTMVNNKNDNDIVLLF